MFGDHLVELVQEVMVVELRVKMEILMLMEPLEQ